MKHWIARLASLAMACSMILCAHGAMGALPEPTADEVAKMEAAMPAKARVEPAKPRRILVFNLACAYPHDAIPYGSKALEIMGRKTGAFEAVVTTDTAMFEPAALAKFDAVVFNNTTGNFFRTPGIENRSQEEQAADREREARLKQSLMDFVNGGKGVIGIHSATDAYYDWTEYGQMMGGYFDGHPWHEVVTLKIDDPASPLAKAYPAGFQVIDEIYMFRDPYSRKALHILTSLDTAKTDMKKDGINRTDGDFAVSWIRSWGKGRVFYNSLGHDHHIFWTPELLQAYLDGIQFALGDLPADTTPSACAK